MKQRILVVALALGLVCTSGVLYGATGDDFDLKILPAANEVVSIGGSVDLQVELTTRIDETQGWSLGVLLDPDAGVTAEITALKFGDVIQTLKEGDPAEFQALNWYTADDLGTPAGACEPACASTPGCNAFNMGVTIQILQQITMPQKPDGIIIAEFTVEASGNPGDVVNVPFSDDVGDPKITTVAVHGGLSFPPSVREAAAITLIEDPCVAQTSAYSMSISGGEGATGDQVDSTVTLNFNAGGRAEGDEIQAWSYGICIDASKLSVVDATTDGTATATAKEGDPPDFSVISIYPEGVTHALAISVGDTVVTIPAQNDWTDMIVTYQIDMTTQGDSAVITPCGDTLGTPPVRNVMSVEGQSTTMASLLVSDDPDECCVADPDLCNEQGEIILVSTLLIIPGSANGDGLLDIADAVYILSWLFRDGLPPPCELAADANDDCSVDSSDAVYILEYIFLEGPEPPRGLGCQELAPDTCPGLTCEERVETNC